MNFSSIRIVLVVVAVRCVCGGRLVLIFSMLTCWCLFGASRAKECSNIFRPFLFLFDCVCLFHSICPSVLCRSVCLSVRLCLFLSLCVSPSICVWLQFVPRNKHIFFHISGMRNPFAREMVFAFIFAWFKRNRSGNHTCWGAGSGTLEFF